MTGSAGTQLRHDLDYLRRVVAEAVRLHPGRAVEERVMLTDLCSYLTWLTVDAMRDEGLARKLVPSLFQVQEELLADAEDRRARRLDPSAPAFYEMYLRTLKLVLDYKHGVGHGFEEFYSRGEFLESWEQTRRRLGL